MSDGDFHEQLQRRLVQMAELEVGWYQPGSLPPDPTVLAEVEAVLPLLDRYVTFAPRDDGSLNFEWDTDLDGAPVASGYLRPRASQDVCQHRWTHCAEVSPGDVGLQMFLMRWDPDRDIHTDPAELHEDVPYDRAAFVRFILTGTTREHP